MSKLASKFGRDLCEQFVAFELMAMADDSEQKVKRATIQSFLKVCQTVGPSYFLCKLLPVYQRYAPHNFRLAKDRYWPVRETAVNIVADIALLSTSEVRTGSLVGMVKDFLRDNSEYVRESAEMQLGRFICSLQGKEVGRELLEMYVALADPKANSDKEVLYACAFYFPGVLLTAGAKEWGMLRVAYNNLLKSKEGTVKVTMLLSIHEVAKILGPKLTTERLDPIVKDSLSKRPMMKLCLNHLHEFLGSLSESRRRGYLEQLKAIIAKSEYEWRLKELFAAHAGDYARLFDPQSVYNFIFPIVTSLVRDNVAEVRIAACKELGKVILCFKVRAEYFSKAISFINELALSTTFRDRQSFLLICEGLMEDKELFEKHFLTELLKLQKDKVVNVRITLAKVLRAHVNGSAALASNLYIRRTIEALREDSSKEVKENISGVVSEPGKKRMNLELLEKAREVAAETLEGSADNDEETAEELRRQETEKLLKKTIKIDEIE